MRLITKPHSIQRAAWRLRRRGASIGFVPTMGALHEGHLALVREAARRTDAVIVSIFVNPLQFGPREDFRRYPRTLERDLALLKPAGCDLVFAPTVGEMYPDGFATRIDIDRLDERFEGAIRPGHFRGVATIVAKLFHLVQPTLAVFGQKDYQQALIIRRMVRDLDMPIMVRVMPTVREPDGVAMSSRNAYLSVEERTQAVALFQALRAARAVIDDGERRSARVRAVMQRVVRRYPLARPDYIVIVDAETLAPVTSVRGRIAILLAARVGATRLIDNILVDVP